MQHLPHPRATTAAWLVLPPVAVRIPCATYMPPTSSGLVSRRTRITFSPRPAHCFGVMRREDRFANRRARDGIDSLGELAAGEFRASKLRIDHGIEKPLDILAA